MMCHSTSGGEFQANSLIHTSPASETTSSSNAGRRLGCSACAMTRRNAACASRPGSCAARLLIHSSVSRSSIVRSIGPSRMTARGAPSSRVTRISNWSAVPRYTSCPDTPMLVRRANGAVAIDNRPSARPTTTSTPGRGPITPDNRPVRSYRNARYGRRRRPGLRSAPSNRADHCVPTTTVPSSTACRPRSGALPSVSSRLMRTILPPASNTDRRINPASRTTMLSPASRAIPTILRNSPGPEWWLS